VNPILRHIRAFMLITLSCCLFISGAGYAEDIFPSAPVINSNSYLLVDFHSGVELAAKEPDKRIEPASITKLMTAYIIYQELKKANITLKDRVLISEKAWKMEGSRMFVEAGKKVPLKRMLSGLIIQSGNDAAIALAEHIAGSEAAFVVKMNEQAKKMGLNSTHYANVTGWPDANHYTTDAINLNMSFVFILDEH